MLLTYEYAYKHRAALDALATKQDRELMCGPDWSPEDPASWHYPSNKHEKHYAVLVDGAVVGSIDFDIQLAWTETGFFLAEPYRGRGIMQAAWMEKSQGLGSQFRAGTWEHNAASRVLLEKLGFELIRTTPLPTGKVACSYMLYR